MEEEEEEEEEADTEADVLPVAAEEVAEEEEDRMRLARILATLERVVHRMDISRLVDTVHSLLTRVRIIPVTTVSVAMVIISYSVREQEGVEFMEAMEVR